MMMISKPQAAPSILLVVLVEITIAAAAWQLLVRRRRLTAVRALAADWRMRFTPEDRFGLAEQLVAHLPTAGGAMLRAADLIYQWEGNDFFCAFTVTFTQGALGTKHRRSQVAGVRQTGNEYSWIVAPAKRKWSEQYAYVRARLMGRGEKKEPGEK